MSAVLALGVPRNRAVRLLASSAFILVAFVVSELAPGSDGVLHPFNWMPLAGQTDKTVSGFQSILETTWPFMAVPVASILAFGKRRPLILAIGAAIAIGVLALEWEQRYIPGRYGDISAMILALVGWAIACVYNFDQH
jgi:hypothetical protein